MNTPESDSLLNMLAHLSIMLLPLAPYITKYSFQCVNMTFKGILHELVQRQIVALGGVRPIQGEEEVEVALMSLSIYEQKE